MTGPTISHMSTVMVLQHLHYRTIVIFSVVLFFWSIEGCIVFIGLIMLLTLIVLFSTPFPLPPAPWSGDTITISSESEFQDAVTLAQASVLKLSVKFFETHLI